MQDVADRLGPTKGNLYHYFASEHDLLSHCHLRGMQDSLRLLDAAAETDDPRWSYWPSSAINGIGTWFDPRGELDAGSIADTVTDFLVAGLRGPRSTSAG